MARAQRYVIRSAAAAAFFTGFLTTETRAVIFKGELIGHEHYGVPEFEALKPNNAVKFDTLADAQAQLANDTDEAKKFYGGPASFEGCTIEPTDD